MPIPTDSEKKACPGRDQRIAVDGFRPDLKQILDAFPGPGSVTGPEHDRNQKQKQTRHQKLTEFFNTAGNSAHHDEDAQTEKQRTQIKGSTGALINCTKKS